MLGEKILNLKLMLIYFNVCFENQFSLICTIITLIVIWKMAIVLNNRSVFLEQGFFLYKMRKLNY